MAKASLVLPSGTRITVEGTKEEVESIIRAHAGADSVPKKRAKGAVETKCAVRGKVGRRSGPGARIRELVQERFFKTKRTISDVQKKLDEKGWFYPTEQLSTPLLRLARSQELRRFKDGDNYVYVNP